MNSPSIRDIKQRATVSVPDHKGLEYKAVLARLHEYLKPSTYFEIGTADGATLAIATCATLAVDPAFGMGKRDFVGKKPLCALYQMPSDTFFRQYNPTDLFGGPIDLAFLDGMHYCEFLLRDFANTERYCRRNSVIALHDCVPVEVPISERAGAAAIEAHRSGWWAGDVWRTVLALQKYRPDLAFTILDAPPTGLVLVTNLNPGSTLLTDGYTSITREMLSWSLDDIGIDAFFASVKLESTSVIETKERMARRFWL